jgi:hypothetical protein
MLPPIIYTPELPKPKETKRRRGIGYAASTGESDETAEAGEAAHPVPPRPAARPQQTAFAPVEAAEQRIPSTTGKLSDGTLKELLLAQEHEQESVAAVGGTVPAAKE